MTTTPKKFTYICPQDVLLKQGISLANPTVIVVAISRVIAAIMLENFLLDNGFVSTINSKSLIVIPDDAPFVGAYS